MYQAIHLMLLGLFMLLVLGCASTTIYPEGNNAYSLVTTSSEQSYAEKDAQSQADKQCTALGKSLVVLQHQTSYHGVNKESAALIGLATLVVNPKQPHNPATSNSDYEVRMKFMCR